MQKELRENMLLGLGNPLLDISAKVDKELLEKYDMKPNDAILAEEKHKTLKDELIQKYNAEFIAGGSVQNSLRVAQWILEKPHVTTYFGCVGEDGHADILKERARSCGVNVHYQYSKDKPTGTCSVLITGSKRSLCADLAAAECFTQCHLSQPENKKLIACAQFYYISGFFLTVSPESIMEIATFAHKYNRPFLMNLSAPFISQFFKKPLMDAFPYVDVIFGNEEEAAAFGKEQNFGTDDLKEIGLKICALRKENEKRPRVAVITQGHNPVILVTQNKVTEIPVTLIAKESIIDTNGAGDAFTGGFLAQYIQDQPLEVCVRCGIYTASEIIQRNGCTYEGKANFKL